MTDPVSAGGVPIVVTSASRSREDGGDGLFAMLLGSRAAAIDTALPAEAWPGPGMTPESWHGPERAAVPIPEPVPAVLENAATPTWAKVFNQDGFFGRAVPGIDGVAGAAGVASFAAAGSDPPGTTAPPDLPLGAVADHALVPSPMAGRPVSDLAPRGIAGLVPQRPAVLATPRDQPSQAQPGPGVIAAEATSAASENIAAPSDGADGPEVAERPIVRCPTGFSPILVAIQELEHGLGVKALIAGLRNDERARLRDEILALLSSHGHPVRNVAVGGAGPGFWKKVK